MIVSVIVPVYNGERTISACIKSLLNQDYKCEVIVVDNNSTDDTVNITKQFPVKLLHEPVQSSYAARNTGLKHASGNILAFTDADCVASPDWISKGLKSFTGNVGCVVGSIKPNASSSPVDSYLAQRDFLSSKYSMEHDFLPYGQTANVFYKKAVFDKIGVFQPWISGGDAELSWRMQLESIFVIKYANDALVYHKHNSTLRSLWSQRYRMGVGDAQLRRHFRLKSVFNIDKVLNPTFVFLRSLYWINNVRTSLIDFVFDFSYEMGRLRELKNG